jgi:hypothetical protein
LPNGIPANTTITDVVIGFASNNSNLFNNKTTGEAPQLSPTYAEYDNGANVFPILYQNFAGTSTPLWWTSSGLITVNNGVTSAYSSLLVTNESIYGDNSSQILDLYGKFPTPNQTDNPMAGYVSSSGFSNNNNPGSGFDVNTNIGSGLGIIVHASSCASSTYTGTSFPLNTDTVFSVHTVSGSSTQFYYNYGSPSNLACGQTSPITVGISNDGSSGQTLGPFYWIRIRSYPPNGVMPSVSFGKAILPAKIQTYVSLTLNNSQSTATSVPFQQMVNMSASVYKGHAASNLQNVEFFYSNGTIIPSWLESYTYSKNALYWLKVGSIPASSTLTVYAGFASNTTNLFNNKTTGEAPQLSSTYAEYDDGADVFNSYWNFAGTSLPSGWTSSGSVTINNGISVAYSGYGETTTNYGLNANQILDVYGNMPSATSGNNAGVGYANSTSFPFPSGNGGVIWDLNNVAEATNNAWFITGKGSSWSGEVSLTATGYHIWSIYWPSSSSASGYIDYSSPYTSTTQIPSTNLPIGFFNNQGSQVTVGPFYWIRIRSYPPSGVMPSVSFNT